MKKIYYPLIIAPALMAVAIIAFPEKYVDCCLRGFSTWATCILPSVFPFMIITLFYTKTGILQKSTRTTKKLARFLHLPSSALPCIIMSAFSGYPAGSRIIKEFYDAGTIDENAVQTLSVICSSPSPIFVIASVGYKFFKNKILGIKIYLAHVISCVIIAIILLIKTDKQTKNYLITPQKSTNVLYEVFYNSVISVAVSGAFIAFFFCLTQIIKDFYVLYPLELLLSPFLGQQTSSAFLTGIVEITNGCLTLSSLSSPIVPPLCAFIITLGGTCVISQQLCYLIPCKIKVGKFIFQKLLQSCIAFLSCVAICAV